VLINHRLKESNLSKNHLSFCGVDHSKQYRANLFALSGDC